MVRKAKKKMPKGQPPFPPTPMGPQAGRGDFKGHSQNEMLPSGYTREETNEILNLGRVLDKCVTDYINEKGKDLRPQVIHMALNYVLRFHDARVNKIGEGFVRAKKLMQDLELRVDEPFKAEAMDANGTAEEGR